jgi:hypothetical protein
VHELVPMSDYPSLVKIGTLLCRHTDSGGWFLQWENQYPGVHTRRQIPFWEEERKDKSELTVMSQTQFHTWSRGWVSHGSILSAPVCKSRNNVCVCVWCVCRGM